MPTIDRDAWTALTEPQLLAHVQHRERHEQHGCRNDEVRSPAEARHYGELIKTEGRRLAKTIGDILLCCRLQARPDSVLNRKPTDIADVITSAIEESRAAAPSGQRIDAVIEPGLPIENRTRVFLEDGTYLKLRDHRLNPEHPPLVKLWVGAALASGFHLPPLPPLVDKFAEREFNESVVFLDNDPDRVQTRSRAAMWALNGLLMLFLAFSVSRALGNTVALGTVAFLAIDPTVAGHLPVVLTDLPFALLATTAIRRWTRIKDDAALAVVLAAMQPAGVNRNR